MRTFISPGMGISSLAYLEASMTSRMFVLFIFLCCCLYSLTFPWLVPFMVAWLPSHFQAHTPCQHWAAEWLFSPMNLLCKARRPFLKSVPPSPPCSHPLHRFPAHILVSRMMSHVYSQERPEKRKGVWWLVQWAQGRVEEDNLLNKFGGLFIRKKGEMTVE